VHAHGNEEQGGPASFASPQQRGGQGAAVASPSSPYSEIVAGIMSDMEQVRAVACARAVACQGCCMAL
jgi:hypothetical protein